MPGSATRANALAGDALRAVFGVREGRRGRDPPRFLADRAGHDRCHGDYHPAFGRSFFGGNVDIGLDPWSAMLGGEAFLERVFNVYRSATAEPGTNVWNTTLLIGWDEPGGTYDHVPPGPVPPPDPAAPAGEFGFRFDRSGSSPNRSPRPRPGRPVRLPARPDPPAR
jgi:Phosphoesterase family